MFLHESARTAAKSRTNVSTNSGKATKRLDRLAPNLAHMCRFIWEWIHQRSCPSRVLGGQNIKRLGKLSNGWTDWHQLKWFTSADSSGNGHRLNTIFSSIPQGAFRGVLRGPKFKSLGNLLKGWPDWHQILQIHIGMDIGEMQFAPQYTRGNFGGV